MTTELFRSLLKGKVKSFPAYFYYVHMNCCSHMGGKTPAASASLFYHREIILGM